MSNSSLEKCERIIMRYCLNYYWRRFLSSANCYFRDGFCLNPLYVEMLTMFVGNKDTVSS